MDVNAALRTKVSSGELDEKTHSKLKTSKLARLTVSNNPFSCSLATSRITGMSRDMIQQTTSLAFRNCLPHCPHAPHWKKQALRAPALQTPPNFNERTPKREKKERKCGGRAKKKSAKFWAPHPSGPFPSAPNPSGPPHR